MSEININPSEEEINFVNDSLRKFNDEKVGVTKIVVLVDFSDIIKIDGKNG